MADSPTFGFLKLLSIKLLYYKIKQIINACQAFC